MADKKFSALDPAGALSGTEIIPIIQSGLAVRTTPNDIASLSISDVQSVNTQTGDVVLDQDDIGDGVTYRQYSATEKTKLAGIATAATANEKATGAEINTGTDDVKFATPKAIADSDIAFLVDIPTVPTKATGAEADTGTNDTKFLTPKAIEDSSYIKAAYADGLIVDSIADSDTTHAPSRNAVYDALALKQPLDSDLTTIAGLTATSDSFMQAKSGAWAARTIAQVQADLLTYSVFVFNSSGSQSGNRFNTWSDLMTAVQKQAGFKIVIGEQNETIPSGSWDFTGIEFWGNGLDAASGGITWTFGTGVTISAWGSQGTINYGMKFKSTSSSAIMTTSSPFNFTVQNVATISATTAAFFSTSGSAFVLAGQGNARILNEGYEIVNFTGSAFAQQAILNWGNGTSAQANLFRSTNAQILVNVLSTVVMDASLYPIANANFTAGVTVNVNFIYAANIQYNVRTSTTGTVTCSKSYAHERANCTSGAVNYTLRSAIGNGDRVSFKKVDSSGNAMNINRSGSDTIDGGTTLTTSTQYKGWELQDVATGVWDIVGVF